MELAGRVVVVTGASGNLGTAVCRRLTAAGARVAAFVHGRSDSDAAAVQTFAADVTDEASTEAAYDEAARVLGPLWGSVHCAGGWAGAPLAETGVDVFDRMIALNLRSAFLCSRAAARRLVPAGVGRIVNVAAFGPATGQGTAGQAVYAASKAGVVALTRALADELATTQVRASCVAPGTMRTGTNARAMPSADASRWVPLEDVAEAIAFLLSPAAASINGAVLPLPSR